MECVLTSSNILFLCMQIIVCCYDWYLLWCVTIWGKSLGVGGGTIWHIPGCTQVIFLKYYILRLHWILQCRINENTMNSINVLCYIKSIYFFMILNIALYFKCIYVHPLQFFMYLSKSIYLSDFSSYNDFDAILNILREIQVIIA